MLINHSLELAIDFRDALIVDAKHSIKFSQFGFKDLIALLETVLEIILELLYFLFTAGLQHSLHGDNHSLLLL